MPKPRELGHHGTQTPNNLVGRKLGVFKGISLTLDCSSDQIGVFSPKPSKKHIGRNRA